MKDTAGGEQQATVRPTNSPSVSGYVVTLSPLASLVAEDTYEIEVQMSIGGNTHIAIIDVDCPE